MTTSRTTGVCLLYMGGPETLTQMEPFLLELFSDRRLIQLPLGRLFQQPFARLISRRRAPHAKKRYAAIGGGTPLIQITKRQADLLQQKLDSEGDFVVVVAMRYSAPRAEEAIDNLKRAKISRLIALPLYPQYSSSTTGSSFADLDRALEASRAQWPLTRINDFHDHPLYIKALSNTITRGLENLDDQAAVVFSAHALPQKLIDRGDPYEHHVKGTVQAVVDLLGLKNDWFLGYQSRSGPVRWMQPDVLDLLAQLGAEGRKSVLVVPVSFVSDHIETLLEIDQEMRDDALKHGIDTFARAPSLNDDTIFVDALTQLVLSVCHD